MSRLRTKEEPDAPDSVRRATEICALRNMAVRSKSLQRTKGHTMLSHLHIELLRLERAALQHLPHLQFEARMEFIAEHAQIGRNGIVPIRQVQALLDQASDIIMLLDLSGRWFEFEDLTEADVRRMQDVGARKLRVKPRAQRSRVEQSGLLRQTQLAFW